MSSFSEEALEKKLSDLNNSQQSIQQLSLWLIHHRKHYAKIAHTWSREFYKIQNSRKLTFLYLANDVVQNARKKAPEFAKEFGKVLKKVVEHLANLKLDDKTVKSISRLLQIWQERGIFEAKIQESLTKSWKHRKSGATKNPHPLEEPGTPPLPKKTKKEKDDQSNGNSLEDKPEFKKLLSSSPLPPSSSSSPSGQPAGEAPEPEELIKAIQELENSASSDAIVREKIARLPPEVSEIGHLDKLQSAREGEKLMKKIKEATELLNDYNDRLQQELKDRKKVGKMIVHFLTAQNSLLTKAEEDLETYRDKLDKLNNIKDDLKSHIQSLPDLTQLPDVTGGLAPLPSAGDLFMK